MKTSQAPILVAHRGYADSQVKETYEAALKLAKERSPSRVPKMFRALYGLHMSFHIRAHYVRARQIGEELLKVALVLEDPEFSIWAHHALGCTNSYLGELTIAKKHFLKALNLYDPSKHKLLGFDYGQDPKVASLCYLARDLWLLGYPDQALKKVKDAISWAEELQHPHSMCYAFAFSAWINHWLQDATATKNSAEIAMDLSQKAEVAHWFAVGKIMYGWALAKAGQKETAISNIRDGLAAYRNTGALLATPYYLALLAEAHAKLGHSKEGLSLLSEALKISEKTGERMCLAELYRLRGEITFIRGAPLDEVVNIFQHSIQVANSQSAKSLELRSIVSLTKILKEPSKHETPIGILENIIDEFAEGFETRDFLIAQSLLQKLKKEPNGVGVRTQQPVAQIQLSVKGDALKKLS